MPLVVEFGIKYVEFENIAHEAEYIALRCASELNQNPTSRIALITHNQYFKKLFCKFAGDQVQISTFVERSSL